MKIAIASVGKQVSEHFGHCENFHVYQIEDNQIKSADSLPNPGHKPGFLPKFLNGLNVNVVVSGGMGAGAKELFKEKGIEVITGASGNVEDVLTQYLQGTLKSTETVCHNHQHAQECGQH